MYDNKLLKLFLFFLLLQSFKGELSICESITLPMGVYVVNVNADVNFRIETFVSFPAEN